MIGAEIEKLDKKLEIDLRVGMPRVCSPLILLKVVVRREWEGGCSFSWLRARSGYRAAFPSEAMSPHRITGYHGFHRSGCRYEPLRDLLHAGSPTPRFAELLIRSSRFPIFSIQKGAETHPVALLLDEIALAKPGNLP